MSSDIKFPPHPCHGGRSKGSAPWVLTLSAVERAGRPRCDQHPATRSFAGASIHDRLGPPPQLL